MKTVTWWLLVFAFNFALAYMAVQLINAVRGHDPRRWFWFDITTATMAAVCGLSFAIYMDRRSR